MGRTAIIEARRTEVLALVQAGELTQEAIAEKLNVSLGTIATDVRALKRERRLSKVTDGELSRIYIDNVWNFLHKQLADLGAVIAEGPSDEAWCYIEGTVDGFSDLSSTLKWQGLADSFKELKR